MSNVAPVSATVNSSNNGFAPVKPVTVNAAPAIPTDDEHTWFDRMAAERDDYAALVDSALEHRIGSW